MRFHFSNLDIRDAILQLLNVIREGNKKLIQHDKSEGEISNQVLKKLNTITSTEAIEKKIDNISTFLLRFNQGPISWVHELRIKFLLAEFL